MLEVKVPSDTVSFGMTMGSINCPSPPLLVYNVRGTVALLVHWDDRTMTRDEADAVILHVAGYVEIDPHFKVGSYIKKLNLEYWLPYERTITISNRR